MAHALCKHKPDEKLKNKHLDTYVGLCKADALVHDGAGLPTLGRAFEAINQGINAIESQCSREKTREWNHLFSNFAQATW